MHATLDRRTLLGRTAGGMGLAALAGLLAQDKVRADTDPLAPKSPHFKGWRNSSGDRSRSVF